jgi:hypothetical protein
MEMGPVMTEKNVYKVFAMAAQTSPFSPSPNRALFDDLNTWYGEFSEDVHTGRAVNMANVSSLSHFPHFNAKAAEKATVRIANVGAQQLSLLALVFNPTFHAMHHRNRELICENIPKALRKMVQNVE